MSDAVLSPKDLALAIGVSESSLKRWADDGRLNVSRTAGGHRRILLSDAIRFIRETQATVVRPELLGIPEVAPVASQLRLGAVGEPEVVLYDALISGDAARARGMILSWFLDGQPLPDLFDGPIHHAMSRMGELWKHVPEGIYLEHRATDICVQALQHLRTLLPTPQVDAPMAVGGARADDPYILPALMCSIILTDLGWRTTHLGPNCPVSAIKAAVNAYHPRMVYLNATSEVSASALCDVVKELAAQLAPHQCALVVGGQQFEHPPAACEKVRVHIGQSMSDLARIARSLQTPDH